MKVNRTYSMDYDLVIQLAKKQNQSQEVCRAVRKHLNNEDEITPADFSETRLLGSLQSRFEIGSVERNLIDTLIKMVLK